MVYSLSDAAKRSASPLPQVQVAAVLSGSAE